jgi:hypothetical protein
LPHANRERKNDTRRKILAGAAVLDEAEGKEEYKAALFKLLGKFLTRPEDRALFGQPSPYSKTTPPAHPDGLAPHRVPPAHCRACWRRPLAFAD